MSEQRAIRVVIMRGGTSKAVFLRANDLPADPKARDALILGLFGSPDPRQIDGLGGADILTSKCAIIGPPTRADADVDYTFAQVSIREPVVDYDINCGNISAAVGVYAIEEGFVRAADPLTTVRVHNTNTSKVYLAHVPVRGGLPQVEGECVVDGVPGTGAEILLDLAGTVGAATGQLLPTGRTIDRIDALGGVDVSIVDLANLCVFVRAGDVGMTGTEGPAEFTERQLDAMMAVKDTAARHLGLPTDGLVPLPVAVAPPAAYRTIAGDSIGADQFDFLARLAGGRPPMLHKAYPGTAAACTAVAALLPGTVVARARRAADDPRIIIGHPSGVMVARADLRGGPPWVVQRAGYSRTARRLLEGYAFVRTSVVATVPHAPFEYSAAGRPR